MPIKSKKFLQGVSLKKGALSRQLGIPEKKNIPIKLLDKIIMARPGQTIHNPCSVGRKRIRVTRLMEHRANLARTLKRIKRR